MSYNKHRCRHNINWNCGHQHGQYQKVGVENSTMEMYWNEQQWPENSPKLMVEMWSALNLFCRNRYLYYSFTKVIIVILSHIFFSLEKLEFEENTIIPLKSTSRFKMKWDLPICLFLTHPYQSGKGKECPLTSLATRHWTILDWHMGSS